MSLSITSAIVPLNYLSMEVLPFLLLAIGVDNLLLLQFHYVDDLMACYMQIMPNILITMSMECAIFLLASWNPSPAIHDLCMAMALSLVVNTACQLTLLPMVLCPGPTYQQYQIKTSKWVMLSLLLTPLAFQMSIGLDQSTVLPIDSHLQDYFDMVTTIEAPSFYFKYLSLIHI